MKVSPGVIFCMGSRPWKSHGIRAIATRPVVAAWRKIEARAEQVEGGEKVGAEMDGMGVGCAYAKYRMRAIDSAMAKLRLRYHR